MVVVIVVVIGMITITITIITTTAARDLLTQRKNALIVVVLENVVIRMDVVAMENAIGAVEKDGIGLPA